MNLTLHASKRLRQRGIREDCLNLLLEYGKPKRKVGNVTELKLNKKDISDITHELKRLIRKLSAVKNKAILIDETSNTIITAYHL